MKDQQPFITLQELLEEFESLGDWESQCEFLIELGFELPKLPPELKTDENKVKGCQSNVWLVCSLEDGEPPRVRIQAESDAMLVNGLVGILLAIFSGKTPKEILEIDVERIFEQLGLHRHLSPARRNGLHEMVKRVRQFAEKAASRS